MSSLCRYEFVDRGCNEFCWNDDNIVPCSDSKRLDHCFILGDSHKKTRCELTNTSSTNGDGPAATYVDQGSELSGFSTLNTMSGTYYLSPKGKGTFISASDGDPMKEASSLVSDSTTSLAHGLKSSDADSNGSEFCGNDDIFSDKTNIIDNNSLSYQLCEINHTSSDLAFIGNAENKDSNDFLYYGWPEIGNFDDIDGMLRSCNSTFDLGFSKDDDLARSGDALKLDVVKNISENYDSSKGYSISDSGMPISSIKYKDSSWASENSDSCLSFAIGPSTTERKDGFIPREKISQHKKQIKLQNHSLNGNSNHISDLPNELTQLPSGLTSHQFFPSVRTQHELNTQCPDTYSYLQNPISYPHSDNSHTHLPGPANVNLEPSTFKSETTDLTSVSLGESSNASIQYMESSHDEMPALPMCEQRERKLHSCDDKYENRQDPEAFRLATPAKLEKLGSPNVQESSETSSGLDDVSLEAASFRQLQLVMEQLDLRMKLCIRDSLYRLASSAERRHNHVNLNAGRGNERDAFGGASIDEEKNSFMDMETDTNPVDRSIAHLLFYRPSHSPAALDSFPFQSPCAVNGSDASPPLLVENSVSKEIAFEAEKV